MNEHKWVLDECSPGDPSRYSNSVPKDGTKLQVFERKKPQRGRSFGKLSNRAFGSPSSRSDIQTLIKVSPDSKFNQATVCVHRITYSIFVLPRIVLER